MRPSDITIFNATTGRPVIFVHGEAGRALLAGEYRRGSKGIEWVCTDLTTTEGNRRFRKLHERITAAGLGGAQPPGVGGAA